MIVVTGGAGFVGSNVVHGLNAIGRTDILVVDDLSDTRKYGNLVGATVADYLDKERFRELLARGLGGRLQVDAVVHQGACSSTTHPDGRYVLDNNYEYSRTVLDFCLAASVPLVYASSASVYGSTSDREEPLNVYAFSKLLFDREVRRRTAAGTVDSQVVGLRYFNVYGPRESHKDEMASVISRFDDAIAEGSPIRLFGEGEGAGPGEHRRDFVWVGDVVDVVLWFLEHGDRSGIYDCGTGDARSFNDVASLIVSSRGAGEVEYVPFPDSLVGKYQSHTCADLSPLRSAGYTAAFRSIDDAIPAYLGGRRRP